MYSLLTFIMLLVTARPTPGNILLIDPELKNTATVSEGFTDKQLFDKVFPLRVQDLPFVMHAAEKAAKIIARKPGCNSDQLMLEEGFEMRVTCQCAEGKTITVWLMSIIEGTKYSYPIVLDETDLRKAQKKLLDLSSYLSRYLKPAA